ncbi:MAG: alpha/beta hydrolase [Sphingobacteriia bacterium]|nr:MAG: alpha/beta hydrolase [Sphingobacteriia bacterium]
MKGWLFFLLGSIFFFPLPNLSAQDNTPIVFVHGFLGSGDNFSAQVQRFKQMGYPDKALRVFDWNSLGARNGQNPALDSFVQVVLRENNAQQIYLVGHSAGGGLGYAYANDSLRAKKLKGYVHIGSSAAKQPAGARGEVPTLNLYSAGDKIAKSAPIPGAVNNALDNKDHFEVATSEESFRAMYRFFHGKEAPLVEAVYKAQVFLSGKACTLGENIPLAGATLRFYAIDLKTGKRKKEKPITELTTDANGLWGPIKWSTNSAMEVHLLPAGTQRKVIYFLEAPAQDNQLVYLRALPSSGMAALLLAGLPAKDDQSVLAVFTSQRAVVAGRDSLVVNGQSLSLPDLAPASKTAIAQFLYDNGDRQSGGQKIPAFQAAPFLNGVDMFLDPAAAAPLVVFYNGRNLKIPLRKSASEGVMVLVLQ